jgi:hypothetical protein
MWVQHTVIKVYKVFHYYQFLPLCYLLYILPFHCHLHVLSKLHPHCRRFIIYYIVRRFFSFSFTSVIWSRILSELYGILPATNCTTVSSRRLHWHWLLAVPFIVSRNIEAVAQTNPASAGIFSVSCCVQEHNKGIHLSEALQLNQGLSISFNCRFFSRCQLSW